MTGEQYFSIAIILIIYLCIDKNLGYRLGIGGLFSDSINYFIKDIFKVPRPIGTPGVRSLRVETATGYSFPSGHTQNASVFWSGLIRNVREKWINILGSLMIILVGLSGVYLGVHRPVDVVFGFVFGILSMIVVNKIIDHVQSSKNFYWLFVIIMPMFIIAVVNKEAQVHKVFGAVLGFCVGYILESKFINFKERASFGQSIIKIIIAAAGAGFIEVSMKHVFHKLVIFEVMRYFLIIIWITVCTTYIINKLHLYSKGDLYTEKRNVHF